MTLYTSHRVKVLGALVFTLSIAASVSAGFFKVTPPRKRLPTAQTYSDARAISDATDLQLTIDAVKVHNLKRFYEESELIKVTLPADNIFGAGEGKSVDPGADAGYYVAISGLPRGKHTLAWSGSSETLGLSQHITYEDHCSLSS